VEEVNEGDTYSFGKHTVTFVNAPMVHWPEAMVTFDTTNGVLFSADAFGTFGALDGKLFADEVDFRPGLAGRRPPVSTPTSWASTARTSRCC
jgi:flavorubredoxin